VQAHYLGAVEQHRRHELQESAEVVIELRGRDSAGTWRPNNGFHSIFEVGCEELLDDVVQEGGVLCGAFADVWIAGEEVEEYKGRRHVVLWEGGVVEGSFVARLILNESIDVLRGDLGDHMILG